MNVSKREVVLAKLAAKKEERKAGVGQTLKTVGIVAAGTGLGVGSGLLFNRLLRKTPTLQKALAFGAPAIGLGLGALVARRDREINRQLGIK